MDDQKKKFDESMISLTNNDESTVFIKNNSEIKTCQHNKYFTQNISSDDADGIGTCYTFNVLCSDCKKILAKRYECISATWAEVLDDEWATRLKLHQWLEA